MRGEIIERPKALGDIRGVSYIFPLFYRFGIINVPLTIADKEKSLKDYFSLLRDHDEQSKFIK